MSATNEQVITAYLEWEESQDGVITNMQAFQAGAAYAATLRQAARVDEGMVQRALSAWKETLRGVHPSAQYDAHFIPAMRAALEAALSVQPAGVPENCRQRLLKEGKPYSRSSCDACGKWAPRWKECDGALAAQPAERRGEAKPVAWWTPRIVSFNGVRTNAPKDVQEQVEGTVAWHAEVIGDSPAVTDRYGVTHRPMPLYLHPAAPVGVPDRMVAIGRVEMARTKQHCVLSVPVCSNAILYTRRESVPSLAAPSSSQGDRRTNYVSGSVDSTGRFQPTQQDDTSAPQGVDRG
jgi:hypothetical protein